MDYLIIENVLSLPLLREVNEALIRGPFTDGKKTAEGMAKASKKNLQICTNTHGHLLDRIAKTIAEHPQIQGFALPVRMSRPMINRFEAGMEYGMHVDQAHVGDIRTDISFTMFLDSPESYDGGELIIARQPQQFGFKLSAGSMVIYPTGSLHCVTQVTRGTRNAIIGWMQSRIRCHEQRRVIQKLSTVLNVLNQTENMLPAALQTNECIQDLQRFWGEQ